MTDSTSHSTTSPENSAIGPARPAREIPVGFYVQHPQFSALSPVQVRRALSERGKLKARLARRSWRRKRYCYHVEVFRRCTVVRRLETSSVRSQVHISADEKKALDAGEEPAPRRGPIRGFSNRSRRRLMTRFHQVRDWSTAWFGHLTYPDEFPSDARVWKRDFKVLRQRMERRWPGARVIAKLELQVRKSGDINQGVFAPHWHFVVWLPPGANLFYLRHWMAANWYAVVGSGDGRHLKAGTRVDPVGSIKGAMGYVAKYCTDPGKRREGFAVGRRWLLSGFEAGELAAYLSLRLEWSELVTFRRMTARFMRNLGPESARFARKIRAGSRGWTCFGLGSGSIRDGPEYAVDRMLRAAWGGDVAAADWRGVALEKEAGPGGADYFGSAQVRPVAVEVKGLLDG